MADPRMLTPDQLAEEWAVVSASRQSDAVQAAQGRIEDHIAALVEQLAAEKQARDRLWELLDCRAGKLLKKGKRFVVVAVDETYFGSVFNTIREAEKGNGTWTVEDEQWYIWAMREHVVTLPDEIPHEAVSIQQRKQAWEKAKAKRDALTAQLAALPRAADGALFDAYEPKAGLEGLWCLWRYDDEEPWRVARCHVPEHDEWNLCFDFIVEGAHDQCEFKGPYSTEAAAEASLREEKP